MPSDMNGFPTRLAPGITSTARVHFTDIGGSGQALRVPLPAGFLMVPGNRVEIVLLGDFYGGTSGGGGGASLTVQYGTALTSLGVYSWAVDVFHGSYAKVTIACGKRARSVFTSITSGGGAVDEPRSTISNLAPSSFIRLLTSVSGNGAIGISAVYVTLYRQDGVAVQNRDNPRNG